jgi:type IV pilus assembly protein PilX
MLYVHNNLLPMGQSAWSCPHKRGEQKGVVLVIALILLIVMSLLAVTSMRNASSSESVAGNVRTTELATQAAEIALRHCESSAIMITKGSPAAPNPANYTTTLTSTNLLRAATAVAWQTIGTWDGTSTSVYVLPSTVVGGSTTYKRPPECMVESLNGAAAPAFSATTTDAFLITARGFGPEVDALANPATRVRPIGTEVWLQSTIEIK